MSEIKDIIPLRQVAGSKNTSSTTYNWLFKVTTYSDYAGPLQVLSAFPIGKTLESMVYSTTDVPSKDGFPICYQFPGFDRCNYDTGWDSAGLEQEVRSIDKRAVITNVSILDRTFDEQDQDVTDQDFEPYSKENRAWYVNVTFTSIDDSGIFETPVINETYQDHTVPAHWGKYVNEYKRVTDDGGGLGATKWSDPLNLENPLITDRNYNDSDLRLVTNSAGIAFDPPIKKRTVKKTISMTWVTPFALDFSRAIGKVNCNKVALSAPCGNPERINGYADENRWEVSEIPGSVENKQYTVYTQEFLPRTLLLNNVDCDIFTVFGRDFFRYTATLLYDRYEHDVFILDEGYETLQKEGWDDPNGASAIPAYGGIQGQFLLGANQGRRQPIQDLNGMQSNRPSLLNGKGRLLQEVNPNSTSKKPDSEIQGSTSLAVWLRWRVRDEVLFTLPESFDSIPTYSTIDEVLDLDCPLMLGWFSFFDILEKDMNPLEAYCQSLDTGSTG